LVLALAAVLACYIPARRPPKLIHHRVALRITAREGKEVNSASSFLQALAPNHNGGRFPSRLNPRQNAAMSEMVIGPVILEGRYVRLEPLTAEHAAGLAEIGLDEDLWRWIPSPVRTFEEMSAYVQDRSRGMDKRFRFNHSH